MASNSNDWVREKSQDAIFQRDAEGASPKGKGQDGPQQSHPSAACAAFGLLLLFISWRTREAINAPAGAEQRQAA